MNLRVLFLLFSPIFSFAQQQSKLLTKDSTMALGTVTEYGYVSKQLSEYCLNETEKFLQDGKTVIICGVTNCTGSYKERKFYEIVINKEVYLIEKEKVRADSSFFGQIERMTPEQKAAFRSYAFYASEVFYEVQAQKVAKYFESCKAKGLSVLDWEYYDESEYTSGTSVKITVHNPTSKTIKYLWFNIVGYNPVGDKVVDPRKKVSTITLKGVGPIAKDENSSYEFDYAWFTDLVETAKIVSIKVQYMDNTFKTITGGSSVIMPKELYNFISEE